MMKPLLLAAAIALPATAALALDTAPTRPAPFHHSGKPSVLSEVEKADYREIFRAIRGGEWSNAAARIDALQDRQLQSAARAELYLAKGSPVVSLEELTALLAQAPELPQAAQLARLAETRGAIGLPELPEAQSLFWAGEQPRRARARGTSGDPLAAELDAEVQPLIVEDQPAAAEALLNAREYALTPEARTEFQQRIAWSYYLTGNNAAARMLADKARAGSGEWALHAAWTAGLASWRLGDCAAASDAFATVGGRSADAEMMAAGNYWAARADMLCARPERVQARLRTAARLKETFYGLIAARALGIRDPGRGDLHDYRDAEWRPIARKANVRTAIALAEIGETGLADEFIRHQAKISPADHDALLHLADDLSLPWTQFWLAHNAPRGARINMAARYPAPDWRPSKGWRIDKSLVFAHALQESSFRTQVVSPAGATGVMQVRPGTAGDIARSRGEYFEAGQLRDPAANIEFGQSYIEYLRDYPGTGGLLPKVIAAYNAGPSPIAEWNTRHMDRGDPLLYIESIPYWETRGYVPIILRNYWVYEQKAGRQQSSSRLALVQGLWPRFPGLPGATAVRLKGKSYAAADSGTK
jgi:soluble lytic murein transglycosylase-like protein